MLLSIQLLGFNKENSSKEFINDIIPTKEDRLTFSKLADKHEEFLASEQFEHQGITKEDIENETEEWMMAFGVLDLDYEYDIKDRCNVSIDDARFEKAKNDCDFTGYDSFTLNKNNIESFYYLFNIYNNLNYEVSLMDESFNRKTVESFKKLIKDKQEKGLPIVVHFIYFTNE